MEGGGEVSDTPQTDEAQILAGDCLPNQAVVSVACSMNLERENTTLRAHAERLAEAAKKKFENDLQAEEELWFRQNEPSGDHESVMRQWHESSDYNDFIDEWEEINQALTLYRAENPKV